jgi:hypothetical protein
MKEVVENLIIRVANTMKAKKNPLQLVEAQTIYFSAI